MRVDQTLILLDRSVQLKIPTLLVLDYERNLSTRHDTTQHNTNTIYAISKPIIAGYLWIERPNQPLQRGPCNNRRRWPPPPTIFSFSSHFSQTKPHDILFCFCTLVSLRYYTIIFQYLITKPQDILPQKTPPHKYPVSGNAHVSVSQNQESHRGSPRIPLKIPRVIPPKDPHFHIITDFATSATGIR